MGVVRNCIHLVTSSTIGQHTNRPVTRAHNLRTENQNEPIFFLEITFFATFICSFSIIGPGARWTTVNLACVKIWKQIFNMSEKEAILPPHKNSFNIDACISLTIPARGYMDGIFQEINILESFVDEIAKHHRTIITIRNIYQCQQTRRLNMTTHLCLSGA